MKWYEAPLCMWPKKNRDSQRQKVYDAENLYQQIYPSRTFKSLEEIHQWIVKISNRKWFQKRFLYFKINIRNLKIHKGRVDGRAYWRVRDGNVVLPKWAWNEIVVLHELAHGLNINAKPHHGNRFCRVFLCLVKHVIGQKEAKYLRRCFRFKKAKFSMSKQFNHRRMPVELMEYQRTAKEKKNGYTK